MASKRKHRNFQGRNFLKERRRDVLSRKNRSKLMSRIRSSGSKMEAEFIASLKLQCKEPFQVNDRSLIGRPDIVFAQQRICVFLDSDFWHGWQYPRWKHLLRNDFWRTKIKKNRERDKAVTRKLRQKGWTVVRVWEHELRPSAECATALVTSMVISKRRISSSRIPLQA